MLFRSTIVTLGLASELPSHLYQGLTAAGVAPGPAHVVASEPPIGSLFSAFLGYNPIQELLGPTGALNHLSPQQLSYVTGRSFFPQLIEQPFAHGMHLAFTFAAIATGIAVVFSVIRPKQYHHPAEPLAEELAEGAAESGVGVGLDESAALTDAEGMSGIDGSNGRGGEEAGTAGRRGRARGDG